MTIFFVDGIFYLFGLGIILELLGAFCLVYFEQQMSSKFIGNVAWFHRVSEKVRVILCQHQTTANKVGLVG